MAFVVHCFDTLQRKWESITFTRIQLADLQRQGGFKMRHLDLDVDSPEDVPEVLSRAADLFHESRADLQRDWQDPNAGKIWGDIAAILYRAARSCSKAIKRNER